MSEKINFITPSNVQELEDNVEKSLTLTDDNKNLEIASEAQQMINKIFDINLGSASDRLSLTKKIEELGDSIIQKSSSACSLLKVKVGNLGNLNNENDSKAETIATLEDLNYEMKKLDPSKINFNEKGLFGRISRNIKRYFEKYKTADTVIKEIFEALEKSKKRLESDNKTLEIKQIELRNLTLQINELIEYATYVQSALEERIALAKEQGENTELIDFIEKNILFAILQKIQDFQQQLVVNQNGYLALDIIINNNKELIRNVKKSQTTTRSALETAVIVASALYDQKIVLKQINMLDSTTNHFIETTSKVLKSQGTAIQKQAIESGPSLESLKAAFIATFEAYEELDTFKKESIPLLKSRIAEFGELAETAEKRIQQIEKNK